MRQESLQFPGSSSFLFDIGVIFAFFQSSGTFPDSCDLWPFKYNQQWPCGDWPAPSVLMGNNCQGCTHTCKSYPDWYTCLSVPLSSSLRVILPFSRLFPLASGTWNWKPVLPVKTKAKETLGTSGFSTSSSSGALHRSAAGAHLPYFCFLYRCTCRSLLIAHHVLYWIQIQKDFDISNPVPACL